MDGLRDLPQICCITAVTDGLPSPALLAVLGYQETAPWLLRPLLFICVERGSWLVGSSWPPLYSNSKSSPANKTAPVGVHHSWNKSCQQIQKLSIKIGNTKLWVALGINVVCRGSLCSVWLGGWLTFELKGLILSLHLAKIPFLNLQSHKKKGELAPNNVVIWILAAHCTVLLAMACKANLLNCQSHHFFLIVAANRHRPVCCACSKHITCPPQHCAAPQLCPNPSVRGDRG